jgi:predicted small secreted protein
MRLFILAALGLMLAGCNTTQTGSPVASAAPATATASADAQALPPIYEPLVDMHRVNPAKYNRDLAECRQQAAPQEAAARAARQQQAAGTAVAVGAAVASFIPVSGFRQARSLYHATSAAQDVGAASAEAGAITADQATADYALVVNTCLSHRKYRILRG